MHDGEKLIDKRCSVCLRKGEVSKYSTGGICSTMGYGYILSLRKSSRFSIAPFLNSCSGESARMRART